MYKIFQTISYVTIIFSLNTGCSYIQNYQYQLQQQQIEKNINSSKLTNINKFTSHTPYHKTYEFEFNTPDNNAFALIFYLSESSFSKSIVKHRKDMDLRRDATRIDDNKSILSRLNKHLPKAKNIPWQQISFYIPEQDARDSYQILQEYIRLKIRDL